MTPTLIYSCVFFNKKYINLVNLLLKSYKLFGSSPNEADYLIICNPAFEEKIQEIFDNLHIKGKLWCLDLQTKFEAGYSRLKIFDYPSINQYSKILYLDCDILVTNSISNMLDFHLKNKLYALQEGNTNHIYHGAQFFDNNPNCPAFTSGILLFNNHITIKNLFLEILSHIKNHLASELPIPVCLDQPFIIYHAVKNNLYDNQKLINIVVNNPETFHHETISHFPGGPGNHKSKIVKMKNFMNNVMFHLSHVKVIPEIVPNDFIHKILSNQLTTVSKERLINLYEQCSKFKNTNCSFVECGVAKGGCLALMKYVANDDNKIFGFDNLAKMPEDTQNVYNTFQRLDLSFHNTELIKGLFENTLALRENINKLGDIAVLRLDGHSHGSVKICLEKLYEKVVEGGVIIIENYGHFIGAKNAIDEFRTENNIEAPLIQVEDTEFYWRKEIQKTQKYTIQDTTKEKNKCANIHDDIWTCSDEFRKDVRYLFKDKPHYKIAEIGSHKGYTTRYLSDIFTKVYAVDNSVEWINFNKKLNQDKNNIEYIHLDLYKDPWDIIPDVDVVLIDALHSYQHCKSDVYNSMQNFQNLKYIIFDDYGVWSGVRRIVNELLIHKTLLFDNYIGLHNVPGPNNTMVTKTSEGIICRINPLLHKKYVWGSSQIEFLEKDKMNAFGPGKYKFIDKYLVQCDFGRREHLLRFDENYSTFFSVRRNDFEVRSGSHL